MTIRSFFAIPLKPAVTRRLADHADSLSVLDSQGVVNWTDADNYHLTLCFLGEISLDQAVALEQVVLEKLRGWPTFQLTLDRAQQLAVNDNLELIAALPQVESDLKQLQQWMVELVNEAGVSIKDHEFVPHITLGRIDSAQPFEAPDQWPNLELPVCADAVVLFQSKPGANGSVYSPLFDIRLERRADKAPLCASLK